MRALLTDFRNCAFSGSLVDLAVGLAIGAAFAAVVESLVGDVILPLVAAMFGAPSFDALVLTVNGAQIRYGSFLTALVSFLLLALTIMFLVQAIRRATGRETAGAQGSRECDHCRSSIPVDASVCVFCTRGVEPLASRPAACRPARPRDLVPRGPVPRGLVPRGRQQAIGRPLVLVPGTHGSRSLA